MQSQLFNVFKIIKTVLTNLVTCEVNGGKLTKFPLVI